MDDHLQLILVDLDNVRARHRGPLHALWASNLPLAPDTPDDGPQCVVAFAMNLDTVDHHVSFEGLRTLAEHLAASVAGAPLLGVEIALTLVVKESADLALERLLVHAPEAGHGGRLAAVHLLSDDGGLRENFRKYLGRNYTSQRHGGVVSWAFAGKKKPTSRNVQKSGVHSIAAAVTLPNPHAAVCTPELVAQLSQRGVDVPTGSTLQQVASCISRRPGLLTQVGITVASVRGVERLGQLADGLHPSLGPLRPDDGLEICADTQHDGDYAEAVASKLGPGAIRCLCPPGTFHTRIPTPLVLAAKGPLPAEAGRLGDEAVLKLVCDQTLRRAETVKVRFSVCVSRRASTLQAEALRGFGKRLEYWWKAGSKAESKPGLVDSPLSLKTAFTVDARCAIDRANQAVILRAPFDGSVSATVKDTSDDVVPGMVDGVSVACLLRPQTAAGEVRLTPIQNISGALFKKRFPKHHQHFSELRRLPLLVPA